MADDPRQPAPLGPAAVSIHDDGDVPRKLLGFQPDRLDPCQPFFGDRHVWSQWVPHVSSIVHESDSLRPVADFAALCTVRA